MSIEAREAFRAHVLTWLHAYPEDIFPPFTADTPDSELTRDRIAGQMGRHMATRLLEWLDEQEAYDGPRAADRT